MKLVIEIEADEQKICAAVHGIPAHFLKDSAPTSPIQLLARALKSAYEKLDGRGEMLAQIEQRMRSNGIFVPDVWDRILQARTSVLREIVAGDFEKQVLARIRKQ